MTGVTLGRVIGLVRRSRAELLVSTVAAGAAVWGGVLVVRADGDAPRHGLWRDPISWFASDEAPRPEQVRTAMLVLGTALVVLSAVGATVGRRRSVVGLSALAGGLVVAIALVPLECSIRFDYCEKRFAAGVLDDSHLVHVVLAGLLTAVAAAAAVVEARRDRRGVTTAGAMLVVSAAAGMLAAPTWEFLGTLQLVNLGGGVIAGVRLWRSAPTLDSPP